MSGPGGAATAADEPGEAAMRVPYAPWRRWVARVRRRSALARAVAAGADPGDRVYLVYGVFLLALVYGPVLWSALAQTGLPLGDRGAEALAGRWSSSAFDGLVVVGLCLGGLVALLAITAARAGGPLWTSPPEARFVLAGQFRPAEVLRRRVVVLAVGAAVAAAFGASALAAGALGVVRGATPNDGATAADVAGWVVVAALAVQLPVMLGVAAQTPRWRTRALRATGVLVGLGVLAPVLEVVAPQVRGVAGPVCGEPATGGVACSLATAPGWGLVAVAGAAAVVSLWSTMRSLPGEIDVDATASAQRTTVATTQALAGGEAGGVADLLGPARLRGRHRTLWAPLLRHAPVVARDLVGVRRRPGPVLGSVLAGTGGALLLVLGSPSTGRPGSVTAVVLGALVLYAASAAWTGGLRETASQPRPGGLLPGSVGRLLAGHLVVPALLGAASAGAGLGLAVLGGLAGLPHDGTRAVVVVASAGVLALAVRGWVAGATTVPAELFTPVSAPGGGDASTMLVAAWLVRGWLTVTALAWMLHGAAGSGTVLMLCAAGFVLLVAVLLVRSTVSRLGRT
ncbi:hypothetical protein GCM10009718_05350 [Isoptericola halotolerans]|uniref:ABC-2 type transport system permease protein n=1 Tax=Isoptericola halotolerans TaxID=300560 RepID=A0ABX2A3R0_9MICO|nr:hypothetical protein [Isoptericola halotolerans]NOV96543.1 hypothetical protein [Isoptericola halotolerans]